MTLWKSTEIYIEGRFLCYKRVYLLNIKTEAYIY